MRKKSLLRSAAAVLIILILALSLAGCINNGRADSQLEAYMKELAVALLQGDALSVNILLADPDALGLANEIASLPLPDNDAGSYSDGLYSLRDICTILATVNYKSLSKEGKRDRDVLMDYFYNRSLYAPFYYFQTDYIGASGGWNAVLPIYLDRFEFNDKHDVENYLRLMEQTHAAFPQYADFEKQRISAGYGRASYVYENIAEQCRTFVNQKDGSGSHYLIADFQNKIEACRFLNAQEKQSYIERHGSVLELNMLPAYEQLAGQCDLFAASLGLNDSGLCYYSNGQQYYALEFSQSASTTDTVPDALGNLLAAYDKTADEYNRLLSSLQASGGDVETEYAALVDSADLSKPALLGYYQTLQTSYTQDFPALPSSIPFPDFREVPEALKDSAAPASYFKSAVDSDSSPEVIYINPGSSSGYLGFDIISHEGITGHQLQHSYFKTSGAHMVRSLLGYLGYAEGWASYSQFYCAKYYDGTERQKQLYQLFCLRQELNLYLYNILDIRINYYGADKNEIYTLLEPMLVAEDPADKRAASDSLFEYLVENPNAYSAYAYGLYKMRELRASYSGTDMEFHTAVLSAGPMTFELLKKHI